MTVRTLVLLLGLLLGVVSPAPAAFNPDNVTDITGTLTLNGLVIGNGGLDLKYLGTLGTATTVLHGNASGPPTFSLLNLATDVTGNLAVGSLNSGTSASSSTFWRGDGQWATPAGGGTVTTTGSPALHQVSVFSGATGITGIAIGATGTYLRGVSANDPIWSTLLLPNAATTGDLFAATNSNTMGVIADVATGQGLMSGGVGVLPAWTGAPTFSGTVTGSTLVANGGTDGTLELTNVTGSGFKVSLLVGNPAANRTWTLPIIDGSNGQVLQTNGSGVLSFAAVAGTGTVTSIATTSPITGGTITTTGTIACATCVTASSPGAGIAHFAGATQAVTSSPIVAADISNNAITSAQMAVVNNTRTCSITVGANNGTALVDADLGPQFRQCFVAYAATIVEVTIASDAGTPSIQIRKNVAGTTTNLLSNSLSAVGGNGAATIACARASTSATCYDGTTSSNTVTVSTTSLAAGSWIELTSGTAGGAAKEMSIAVTYTVN